MGAMHPAAVWDRRAGRTVTETGAGVSGILTGKDFFAQTRLDLSVCTSPDECDAALAALLLRYLRHQYDIQQGAWPGQDGRDTLRLTCHAAEVLHQLDFDHLSERMTYQAGNWLINLAFAYQLTATERTQARLYPSRFKTLAYLGRFDDEQVRRDFTELLDGERDGLIEDRTTGEAERGDSTVLRTCIALDTLLTLDRQGLRHDLCPDARYQAVSEGLRASLRAWRPGHATARRSVRASALADASKGQARDGRPLSKTAISSHRELSYALGLLCTMGRRALPARTSAPVVQELLGSLQNRDRTRFGDMPTLLYPALQLAEHFSETDGVAQAVRELLEDLRAAYVEAETPRRWELSNHTLVLRLLLATYTPEMLAHGVAARLLEEAERHERVSLESDLITVIRERMRVGLASVRSLSGGFTEDQVLHVQFRYWFASDSREADIVVPATAPEGSLILKRSTSSAFHTATTNYGRLPTELHTLFIRQPSSAEVFKSTRTPAYYLPMEDLTNLVTFREFFDELDQRAMSPRQLEVLTTATDRVAEASLALFRATRGTHTGFAGPQIARLYLSGIEAALVHGIRGVPWLKTALDGYTVGAARYRGIESYLTLITRRAQELQPKALGLVHGDFHARNIMLDRQATQVKLIDLDKLSWSGDYLADAANLLVDIAIYRRLVEPERIFGLPADAIVFRASKQAEKGTAENAIEYPALGRPATHAFQTRLLEQVEAFALELGDERWRPRFWLAAAAALLFRIGHHTERDIAAVLYGEAIRLLHELKRSLEDGSTLPDVVVPDAWPDLVQPIASDTLSLPGWLTEHELLRAVHDGICALGLRAAMERESVLYHAPAPRERLAAVLVRARQRGAARLMLRPLKLRRVPETTLELASMTSAEGVILSLAVIVTRDAEVIEVLRVARECLGRL